MMNIRLFLIRFGALAACLALCAGPAAAEGGDRWTGEYQACGRTVRVDAEISVPEEPLFPFLAVEPMAELSGEEAERCRELFSAPEGTEGSKQFINKGNTTAVIWYNRASHPDLSDADKVTTPNRPLYAYEGDKAYTEDNDLTVNEAEALVRESIRKVFPDVDFRLREVIVNDRTRYRKSGEKLADKGYYELNLVQAFGGVPLAASIHRAYRTRYRQDAVLGNNGSAYACVTDRDNFEASYILWDKTAELGTPDRLLSFEEVRPAIEDYILRGNIRTVYSVCLGYAQYDLPEGSPREYVLAPAWVVWAGWLDDPAEEPDTRPAVNGTDYTAGYVYLPIIVNAVTGEAADPMDESENRMLLPASCMAWVE